MTQRSLLEILIFQLCFQCCRDRLVVRTLRCGRSNPGSNPGHGTIYFSLLSFFFFLFQHKLFCFCNIFLIFSKPVKIVFMCFI